MSTTKKTNWLHVAISWGASIVILGAMFKINHWGGQLGTYMIGLGLTVEAILFFTLGFFPPSQEPAWERVYPELASDYEGGLPNPISRNQPGSAFEKLLIQSEISPESIDNLSEGLKRFTAKMDRINSIADATLATDDFMDKLKQAASKFDILGMAFEKATSGLAAVADSRLEAESYHHQVSKLTINLSLLNSLYESELKGADHNLRQINHFYQGLSTTLQNLNESADDSKQFRDEVNKLAKNISALNVFYANMLSAMNQPRI